MHFVFIPYGKKEWVELLISEMVAQKHKFPMYRDNEKREIWLQGQIRILPFGIMEYVFPREDLDVVLSTLLDENIHRYDIPKTYLKLARKILKLEPLPKEFKNDRKFLWIKENVNIIPLGIRQDADIVGTKQQDLGFTHEAI